MKGMQGKPQTSIQDALIGQTLHQGEYAIEAVIGRGGMGMVYLASHRTLDVPVAIKQAQADRPLPESVIAELDNLLHNKQIAPNTPFQETQDNDFPGSGGPYTDRFLREALLLARLQHPAIPTLYDYFFEDGFWYLVMEYVPGPTLASYIHQYAPLPALEALNYAMQICDVLDYLHRQTPPVIFRDLKPSNIILTPEGRLMLIDFGIARYFKEGQVNDTTDFGSPGYASPEQYEGSGQTDGRSDLYSLGVILHEMVSGQRPARTSNRGGNLDALHQINPALSPALSGLVTVATRPEPMYRFQTAHTFFQALERARAIEEQRAYRRHMLLADEEQLTEAQNGQRLLSASPTYVLPRMQQQKRKSQTTSHRAQRLHQREHLQKEQREQLEQEALAIQLASIDESLKIRASSGGILSSPPRSELPSPPATEEPVQPHTAARPKTFRRVLQVIFAITLLLSLALTSAVAYNHFLPHAKPIVSLPKTQVVKQQPTPQSTWQTLPSLPSPEADNTASYIVINGHAYIYVSGGFRGVKAQPQYSRGLFRYDLATAHWDTLTSANFPIMGNNAAAVDEHNHIFFTGGYSSDIQAIVRALYMYQPENGHLTKILLPAQILIGFGSSMIADHAGHLYISEGFTIPGNSHTLAGTGWYRFDISTGQWHILTSLPVGLGYVVLANDNQGGILLIGGSRDAGQSQPTRHIYRYDTFQNTWMVTSSNTPIPLSGAASCMNGQNSLVIIGGFDPQHNATLNQTWRMDVHNLSWQPLPPIINGGSLLGAAACDNQGHIYLERGASTPQETTADFLELTLN
jgi:serine/threonine protein kinase